MPFDTRFFIFFIRLPIFASAAARLLTPAFLAGFLLDLLVPDASLLSNPL
jgi:hypothetical protein